MNDDIDLILKYIVSTAKEIHPKGRLLYKSKHHIRIRGHIDSKATPDDRYFIIEDHLNNSRLVFVNGMARYIPVDLVNDEQFKIELKDRISKL